VGIKEGCPPPPKNRYFTTIGSSSVKTVADGHRLAAATSTADDLSGGTNIDDLERP